MAKKRKHFTDEGWAIWVDGEDVSTIFINDWINPKGKSYIDLAVNILTGGDNKALNVYVPFEIEKEEIIDVSEHFKDPNVLVAIFGTAGIVDYKKNEHVSEIAYSGKTVDVVHIGTVDFSVEHISNGTFIRVDLEALSPFIDNQDVYFIWRMPHKSLDEVFKPRHDTRKLLERLRDLITTPIYAEKYGYSVRINETRLLPNQITSIPDFHRQHLDKTAISISVSEDYELNDGGCYRIRRLEENLYKDYLPENFDCEDVITYQWSQTKDNNNRLGHFNFYFSISRESIGRASMAFYIFLLVVFGVAGEAAYELICFIVGLFL